MTTERITENVEGLLINGKIYISLEDVNKSIQYEINKFKQSDDLINCIFIEQHSKMIGNYCPVCGIKLKEKTEGTK